MKSVFLFLILFTVGFACAAEPVEHRSSAEPYTDLETKAVFPAEAGVFRKQEVIRSFNPMIGTTIRYANQDGDCADIYIYTLPDSSDTPSNERLLEHYRTLKTAILGLPSKEISVKEVKLAGFRELKDKQKRFFAYSAEFQIIWNDGTTQSSILQLAWYQKKIIKLRMTCSRKNAETFSRTIWEKTFSYSF